MAKRENLVSRFEVKTGLNFTERASADRKEFNPDALVLKAKIEAVDAAAGKLNEIITGIDTAIYEGTRVYIAGEVVGIDDVRQRAADAVTEHLYVNYTIVEGAAPNPAADDSLEDGIAAPTPEEREALQYNQSLAEIAWEWVCDATRWIFSGFGNNAAENGQLSFNGSTSTVFAALGVTPETERRDHLVYMEKFEERRDGGVSVFSDVATAPKKDGGDSEARITEDCDNGEGVGESVVLGGDSRRFTRRAWGEFNPDLLREVPAL